ALLASRELGANATDVLYSANSGDVTGDRSRVVGYLAAAIYKGTEPKKTLKEQKQAGIDLGLSTEDKALLHRIAKESIEAHCAGKEPPTFEVSSARLKESRGAFVTLHKNGELRGCIGHIIGDRSLAETVAEMAVAAAFQDPRFPPVTADELPDLDIEISAMTPLRRITDVEEIQVGRDGIIVQQDGHSGLLLPQVATQYGWDRETFLDYTCRKANLPPDAWKDKNTTIYIFSADVF
ncbi:MAG: AmmeMemoRadiSam system protein A, partial [Desulfoferrobacter sp.]